MDDILTIVCENAVLQIVTTGFFDAADRATQKRLLKLTTREPQRNTDTIKELTKFITDKRDKALEAWRAASLEYEQGYCEYALYSYDRKMNTRLQRAVRNTNAAYEQWNRLYEYFQDLKTKNGAF